jgi:hypothetical protein
LINRWLSGLNRKVVIATAVILIALIGLTLFFTHDLGSNQTPSRQFYVGVEYAYGANQTAQVQLSQVQALVDKVKDYTNLFVIGSLGLTFDQTALTQACDYVFNAKLNFIVLFTGLEKYSYGITVWMQDAKSKYGDKFLGIYRYDEPGGNQLDMGASQLINRTTIGVNATYADVAKDYVGNLSSIVQYYQRHAPVQVFTADYGLYWFDYNASYNALFADFVGNESRQRIIALDRGAAEAFNKDWGVIVTWKYNQSPYLESGNELYADLSLAYSAGAKYAVVFSYPNTTNYGILTEEHFSALQKFWNALNSNSESLGSNPPTAAYIVPEYYGFGFRSPDDTIWGLFSADNLSAKIYNDVNALTSKYGSRFDILYDDPAITTLLLRNYTSLYYWNQTIS